MVLLSTPLLDCMTNTIFREKFFFLLLKREMFEFRSNYFVSFGMVDVNTLPSSFTDEDVFSFGFQIFFFNFSYPLVCYEVFRETDTREPLGCKKAREEKLKKFVGNLNQLNDFLIKTSAP